MYFLMVLMLVLMVMAAWPWVVFVVFMFFYLFKELLSGRLFDNLSEVNDDRSNQ